MPSEYSQGMPVGQYDAFNAGVIPADVFGVAINWFVNRTPLTSRLPKQPVGSPEFKITVDAWRSRDYTFTAAIADGVATSVTPSDATALIEGDVLQCEDEYMLVTAATANGTTITVARGHAGSSAASHAKDTAFRLIGNTRRGNEVDVNGLSRIPKVVTQYCQTVQHPYQVGGSLQADSNFVSGVAATPLDRDRMIAMQHAMDDFESSIYYGPGVAVSSATARPAMRGIFGITGNSTSSPSNASAYKPDDLIRDTIQKCFDGGGQPNLLLVSTDFLSGFAVWGQAAMRLNAGANVFGTPIDLFEVSFLTGVMVVPAPLLRKGSAICLSAGEAKIRMKRNMFDKPRGSRGDAFEGDIIMEGAIELDNPSHHAVVSGITGFAKVA